jgi:Flp pilus assembly protein TadG
MVVQKMSSSLKLFLSDRRGATAILVAVSIVPVTLAALGAVDIARFSVAKVQLQDALDAGALAAAHTTSTDANALQTAGKRVFDQNLRLGSDFTVQSATFTFGANGQVVGAASATVTPFVAGLVTGGPLTVSASAEVTRANNKLEVALVLDNTGSMAQSLGSGSTSKISALKAAADSMVDTLSAAAKQAGTSDAVKISLVPYTMTVNVGPQYSSAAWLSPGLPSAYGQDVFATAGTNRLTLFQQLNMSWGGCVESRPSPYDVTESPPTTATPGTLYVPYFAPDEPGSNSSTTWNNQSWNNNYLNDVTTNSSWSVRQGYVAKYTASNIVNTGTTPMGYKYGPNAGCSIQPLHRLSNDFADVKTSIDAMTVGGDTDIKTGVMWGWHTLSPNAPFSDGVPYNTQGVTKAMVLMSDGQNHNVDVTNSNNDASVYSGIGYIWQNRLGITSGTLNQRIAVLDQKLSQACTNAKAAGIVMYVVVLVDPSVDQSTLKSCASSTDKLYIVTDTRQLTGVFNSIAQQLAKLHLSK